MLALKPLLCLLAFSISTLYTLAQESSQIVVPGFNDKYCQTIATLEAGNTNIDYQEFRFSFVKSKQFNAANRRSSEFDSLKKEMYKGIDKSDYPAIISITKQMLSIDYTSMLAHKILQQTYKIIGDTLNWQKYHDIEFGLLNSIVKKGDGKTCATAWPVIQVSEEYFILDILDAELEQQSIYNKKGLCDMMEVKIEGKPKTYFFEITKVFEGYNQLDLK